VVTLPVGRIVRPLLQTRRAQVEEYLRGLGQEWREDSSNAETVFTRNRLRHEMLPQLRAFNPNLDEQMDRMASIARDEEAHWQAEIGKLMPQVLLPGRPVRGGGRAVSTTAGEQAIALDLARLASWDTAVQRRILRAAARELGHALDFVSTARLLDLMSGRAGAKATLAGGLQAERTARELRLTNGPSQVIAAPDAVICQVPGETEAPAFGLRVVAASAVASSPAILRVWKPGDRVRLRHTMNEQKVKEVLQRLHATPEQKACWPVLVWQERVVWMQGAEVQSITDAPAFKVLPI
jgi:tRNA(Ile)-lysidine synthase